MKTKAVLITLITVVALTAFLVQSCSKDEEKANIPPTCIITSPTNGQEIPKGDSVTIYVEANDSDGTISEVRFDIDGIGKSSASSYPFIYTWVTNNESLGNHTLKTTSYDNDGGSTSDEVSFEITQGTSDNTPPTALFTIAPSTGTTSTTFAFDASGSNDNEEPTSSLQVRWDFEGNGIWDTDWNNEKTINHQYSNEGTYAAKMEVKDTEGLTNETTVDVIVVNPNTPPTALFTVSPDSGTTNTNFSFDANSCSDNETPTSELQVRWDFDDDGAWDTDWNTEKTQYHQYSTEATYNAKMEVKDIKGLTDQYTKSVVVSNSGGGAGSFTDPRDGQTYATIEIGSQTWMAENLNYETENSWWYDNNSVNGDIYGRLYTWNAAMNGAESSNLVPSGVQGVCPYGWHLPSDKEWKILEMALGMNQGEADDSGWRGTDEGQQMKSTSGWDENGNGTNSSNFNAFPGGAHLDGGTFMELGSGGYWWSSRENMEQYGYGRRLAYDNVGVFRGFSYFMTNGFSVRCIKD